MKTTPGVVVQRTPAYAGDGWNVIPAKAGIHFSERNTASAGQIRSLASDPLTSISTLRLVLLLALPFAVGCATVSAQERAPDPGQAAELAVRLSNEFRAEEKRREVVPNARLLAAARYFAGHMAKTGKFSHEADGTTPAARARQHGYDYCIVLENIAYRYSSAGFATRELAQGFVEGWKKSPGHRRNMLEPDVTETAVAVARGKPGHYYAVQMFGRPASDSIKFSVANRSDAAIRYRIDEKVFSLTPRQIRTHQNCRVSEVEFDWPGRERGTKVRPKKGDSFAVVRAESGGFALKAE